MQLYCSFLYRKEHKELSVVESTSHLSSSYWFKYHVNDYRNRYLQPILAFSENDDGIEELVQFSCYALYLPHYASVMGGDDCCSLDSPPLSEVFVIYHYALSAFYSPPSICVSSYFSPFPRTPSYTSPGCCINPPSWPLWQQRQWRSLLRHQHHKELAEAWIHQSLRFPLTGRCPPLYKHPSRPHTQSSWVKTATPAPPTMAHTLAHQQQQAP